MLFRFGSLGLDDGAKLRLRQSDLRLTRHAYERVSERLNVSNPTKELRKLLNKGVLIIDRQDILRITNGIYTFVCVVEGCLFVAVTFRHANSLEKRVFYRKTRKKVNVPKINNSSIEDDILMTRKDT